MVSITEAASIPPRRAVPQEGAVFPARDDLAPAMGLLAGVATATLLWAMPVATWLLLR